MRGDPTRERLAKALIEIVFSNTTDANDLRIVAMRALNWDVVPPAKRRS